MAQSKQTRAKATVDVFRYQDYRRFLADFYAAKKVHGYSYRAFAKAAGLGAPNYLRLVIDGDRNLSPQMVERFARACELGEEASAYFQHLVSFNQAQSQEESNAAFERLRSFRRYRKAQKLELAQADYHGTWYLPAIRELVRCKGFKADPEWLAGMLRPALRPAQTRKALQTLLDLGMLQRAADGSLRQHDAIVSTGPETQGMHIRNYHAEMMRHATVAMENIPQPERDMSSLTLSVGSKSMARIKRRLQELRRELLEMAEAESDPVLVVQLNLQLYPLTYPVRRAENAPSSGHQESEAK